MKMLTSIAVTFAIFFSILSLSQKAQAYGSHSYSSFSDGSNGWMLQADGIYYFYTEGGNPPNQSNTTYTRQLIDGMFGYHFNLFFLGANYSYDSVLTSGTSSSQGWFDAFRGYGADLGIITQGVSLIFTYYFLGNGTTKSGIPSLATDYTNCSGYQISLGYSFDVGSGWGIGPSLTYKSLTYSSFASGPSTSYTYTTLVPEASIRYNF